MALRGKKTERWYDGITEERTKHEPPYPIYNSRYELINPEQARKFGVETLNRIGALMFDLEIMGKFVYSWCIPDQKKMDGFLEKMGCSRISELNGKYIDVYADGDKMLGIGIRA